MPRYYRRRSTRVVRPKKKWATNFRQIAIEYSSEQGTGAYGGPVILAANSNEVNLGDAVIPTPTIIKTGNFKIQLDCYIETNGTAVINTMGYILYIPEGVYSGEGNYEADWNELDLLVRRHPEWVLAWKQFGFDQVGQTANLERVSFSSRLKRNLNSGDRIVFALLAASNNGNVKIKKISCNGMCQFWTCNN